MTDERKTVIFEIKYGTDIKKFSTTEQVDYFIEGKLGRVLRVTPHEGHIVTKRGSIFPLKNYDIDTELDKILGS